MLLAIIVSRNDQDVAREEFMVFRFLQFTNSLIRKTPNKKTMCYFDKIITKDPRSDSSVTFILLYAHHIWGFPITKALMMFPVYVNMTCTVKLKLLHLSLLAHQGRDHFSCEAAYTEASARLCHSHPRQSLHCGLYSKQVNKSLEAPSVTPVYLANMLAVFTLLLYFQFWQGE